MTLDVGTFATGWQVALPALVALATAVVVMVTDLALRGSEGDGVAAIGVIGLVATIGVALVLWVSPAATAGFGNTLRADRYALFFVVVVCAGAALTVLMSVDYLRDHPLAGGEYYARCDYRCLAHACRIVAEIFCGTRYSRHLF